MPISALLTGLGFAPNLLGPLSVIDEPLREIHQAAARVEGVLFKSV
jgi:hypothetical protein